MTNATLSGSAAGALGRGNKVYGNNAYAIGSENTGKGLLLLLKLQSLMAIKKKGYCWYS